MLQKQHHFGVRKFLSLNNFFGILKRSEGEIMAKEYIELEPGNEYGVISLNKTVFSTIAKNVIEEDENVQIAEGTKPFKTGIVTRVEDNKLTLSIPVKVNHKSNVSDVCLNLQNKIFESISYMTDFKPEAIEIQVTGFIF